MKQYTIINTHKSLHQYNRLQFGLLSWYLKSYCRYRISSSEIEPVIEKVEAVQNVSAQQNVSQLRIG